MGKPNAKDRLAARLAVFTAEVEDILRRKVGDSISAKDVLAKTEAEIDVLVLSWVQRMAYETLSEIAGPEAVAKQFDVGYSQIIAEQIGPGDFANKAMPYDDFRLHGRSRGQPVREQSPSDETEQVSD